TLVSAAAVIAAAGISAGGTMKLKAVAEYQEETYFRKTVYKDDNGYCYTFDADKQELRSIENINMPEKDYTNVMAEDLKPFADTEALLADAEKFIDKWCEKDTKSELKLECRQKQWDTAIDIYQVVNGEIRFGIGSIT
ncbi:MAG: hypothetical protein NC223_05870, partial [Butyrivibrio sp.]|nr:hypothetical protein [Butyrivibrio sp.]